ncbi:C40 family peptidase [Ligilactobacillus sp.]|uniref:C40 family peptidase n=1 Tax=Ligilactobacillus sp. TaxID=2767921 RepID=UPI002FE309B3
MKNSKLFKLTLTAAAALTFASYAQSSAKADTQADIDAVTQKIKDTEQAVKDGQVKLSKLEDLQFQKSNEILKLQKNIKARKAQLARQARAAQINNAGSMIDFVTSADSLSDAVNRTFTVATLVRANNQAVAQQKADKEKVAADKAVVDKAASSQKETNKKLNNDIAQLAVQKTQLEVKKAKEDAAKKAAEEAAKKAQEAADRVAKAKNERETQNALNDANKAVAAVTKTDNDTKADDNTKTTQAQVQQTSTTSTTSNSENSSSSTVSAAPAAKYGSVVGYATSFCGVPYKWGGASPSGFDCSGLVMYVYAAFGKSLPHSSYSQQAMCTQISESQLQPGDLVFFNGGSHVGIYVGGGSFVHAPQTGDVVKVTSLKYMRPSFCGRLN